MTMQVKLTSDSLAMVARLALQHLEKHLSNSSFGKTTEPRWVETVYVETDWINDPYLFEASIKQLADSVREKRPQSFAEPVGLRDWTHSWERVSNSNTNVSLIVIQESGFVRISVGGA